jgi:anti-sigma regulatory factor (Ser/Thr protein kinase)
MHCEGEASVPGGDLIHQALVYGSDHEFMDVAVPFIAGGLDAEEPTLVAVQDRHVQNLREALGGTPEGLELHAVEEWYETSARTRDRAAEWVAEHAQGGRRARLIGEPEWPVGHRAQVRDWARYEAVVNVAYASLPVTCLCSYDAGALPDHIIEHALATHPELVDGGTIASDAYVDPREFCQRLDTTVEAQRHAPSLETTYSLDDLPALRRLVGSFAIEAGLSGSRTEEIVLAVNEITTNAVIHGRPPTTLRAWQKTDEIIFEVTDAGDGIRDVLAGQLPPPAEGFGGRGIWLTRLLCDVVEIRDVGGCTVTMHAATDDG